MLTRRTLFGAAGAALIAPVALVIPVKATEPDIGSEIAYLVQKTELLLKDMKRSAAKMEVESARLNERWAMTRERLRKLT